MKPWEMKVTYAYFEDDLDDAQKAKTLLLPVHTTVYYNGETLTIEVHHVMTPTAPNLLQPIEDANWLRITAGGVTATFMVDCATTTLQVQLGTVSRGVRYRVVELISVEPVNKDDSKPTSRRRLPPPPAKRIA
jgi:hypothetical protein